MSRKTFQILFFLSLLLFFVAVFYLFYNKKSAINSNNMLLNNFIKQNSFDQKNDSKELSSFKLAFISDTHLNSGIFPSLKSSLKKQSPLLLVHAGDLSDYGTISELTKAKMDLDSLDVKYIALPGDHDIAETSSDKNFNSIFSYPLSYTVKDVKVLFLPNFYNFTTLPINILKFTLDNIESANVIVSSQPIYVEENNIFFNKFMGSLDAFDNISSDQLLNLKLYRIQRDQILGKLRDSKSPKLVISGDHHRSSTFKDPINPLLTYHILGSLSKYIYFGNTKLLQTSLQSNRYSIVTVTKNVNGDYSYDINEVEIN